MQAILHRPLSLAAISLVRGSAEGSYIIDPGGGWPLPDAANLVKSLTNADYQGVSLSGDTIIVGPNRYGPDALLHLRTMRDRGFRKSLLNPSDSKEEQVVFPDSGLKFPDGLDAVYSSSVQSEALIKSAHGQHQDKVQG